MPYLVNTKKFLAPELPEAPLIVFINSKSGGHAGPQLTEVLYHTLGHAQAGPSLRSQFLFNNCARGTCGKPEQALCEVPRLSSAHLLRRPKEVMAPGWVAPEDMMAYVYVSAEGVVS